MRHFVRASTNVPGPALREHQHRLERAGFQVQLPEDQMAAYLPVHLRHLHAPVLRSVAGGRDGTVWQAGGGQPLVIVEGGTPDLPGLARGLWLWVPEPGSPSILKGEELSLPEHGGIFIALHTGRTVRLEEVRPRKVS